jgi:hypothetical protein
MGHPNPTPAPRPRRQLNLRLEQDAAEILEALAFLEGKASIQEVVMPLVDEFVEAHRNDPQILELLKQRADYRGRDQPRLWRGVDEAE